MTGIKKNIKAAGKAEVNHFAPLPEEVIAAIHKLLGQVLTVMKFRMESNPIGYEKALKSLPAAHRNNYHELLVLGAEYVVISFDMRRGQEGVEFLTKAHFQIVDKDGLKRFEKVHIFHYFSHFFQKMMNFHEYFSLGPRRSFQKP